MHPWLNGIETKMMMAKFSRLGTFICLTRDRDGGSVWADPETGNPRIDYNFSKFDREHGMEGLVAMAKLCYVSGATEIQPHVAWMDPFIVDRKVAADFEERLAKGEAKDPEFSDPVFKAWLQKLRAGINTLSTFSPVASAHQMGSCRMSATPEAGVVDQNGKVWGREGLYVADASVLPSASGVNPMITNLSISDWISRGISEGLKEE